MTPVPSQETPRPIPSSPLDDPVDFAHELFNKLTGGCGSREIPVEAALDAMLAPFTRAQDQLRALVADHPKSATIRELLNQMEAVCLTIASDQRDLGTEFGIASEQFRTTLVAGLDGPRRCRGKAE